MNIVRSCKECVDNAGELIQKGVIEKDENAVWYVTGVIQGTLEELAEVIDDLHSRIKALEEK